MRPGLFDLLEPKVDKDGRPASPSAKEDACLESGIKPWQASVGVGGTVDRLACFGR